MRKYYTPTGYNNYAGTMEQYLLTASKENKYLDIPLTEKNLVGAMSKHFGADIAKQVSMTGIDTVEEFAKILNMWENIDRESASWNNSSDRGKYVQNRRDNGRWNGKNREVDRRRNEEEGSREEGRKEESRWNMRGSWRNANNRNTNVGRERNSMEVHAGVSKNNKLN